MTKVVNLSDHVQAGSIYISPFVLGSWSLLQSAGLQNHAPQLCWIDEDTLACVWMAGEGEGRTSMSIFGSVLKPRARAWSQPKKLSQDELMSEQNPVLFVSPDKRLHLIHTAQEVRKGTDESDVSRDGTPFSMQWTASLRFQSTREWGKKWTKARTLIDPPMFCRHAPVQLESGNWILPAYRSSKEGSAFGRDFSVIAHLSENLDQCIEVSEIDNSLGRVHGCIVKAEHGGGFLQFFRSRLADKVYRSVGSPDGRNWTEPHPVALPNNNSSFQILRMSAGPLVAVYNRFGLALDTTPPWGEAIWPQTRWPLSVAVSTDEGITWPWIRDIDFGFGYCGQENWMNNHQMAYPTIVEGRDQRLHIAYSWGNRMAIKYVSIHLGDIVN